MIYFVKSEKKKGARSLSVCLLEKQILPGDSTAKTKEELSKITYLISKATKDVISSYPEGSIFVAYTMKHNPSGSYSVGTLTKLDSTMKKECEAYEKLTGIKFVKKEVSLLDEIVLDKTLKCPTSSEDGFYMSSDSWSILVRNIKKNVNTMIIGPTGTGKTSCVKEVCDRLGKKLHIFDMGCMIDPISSLLGVHRLSGGKSIFDYAKFTQVIQEPCVILLDELNRASLACNNVLFSCLDDRRSLSIDIAGGKDKREIKVHPDVTFIATANIGSEYSGTNAMDRALVNRFFPLELGVIPSIEESNVLIKRSKIGKDKADLIVKVANNIRSLSFRQEISVSLSIRETLLVAYLVADGWDLGKAMEMIYLPLYEGTKSEGERSTVFKTISSY